MDTQKTEALVRKLVALAGNNPNAEEAALAFAKAQEIATRAGLNLDALLEDSAADEESEPEHTIEAVIHTRIDTWDRSVPWKLAIAGACARANGCGHYYSPGKHGGVTVYGQPADVETCRAVYLAIVHQVEPMAERAVAAYKANPELDPRFDDSPREYGRAWRLGCAYAVANRLPSREEIVKQARAEVEAARAAALALTGAEGEAATATACNALVRVNKASEYLVKAEESVKQAKAGMKLRNGGGFQPARSSSGFSDGAKAGKGVSLGGGKALGSAKR